MKKTLGMLVVLIAGVAVIAQADMRVVTVSGMTNGQAIKYSDPIQIAGVLEKVEIVNSAAGTNTITLASYTGTTALDTFVSISSGTALTKVVKPMFLPTDTAGTGIASVTGTASGTNTTTMLVVPYQKFVIEGGLVKLAVTSGSAGSDAVTNSTTATIYYTPFVR